MEAARPDGSPLPRGFRVRPAAALAISCFVAVACLQQTSPPHESSGTSERFADLRTRPLPERLQPAPTAETPAAAEPTDTEAPPPHVVARMELVAPSVRSFLLHGTLPVPAGALATADSRVPLGVVSHGEGRAVVPAQIEIVTRSPAGDPEVIEILARVELGKGEKTGDRVRYNVVDVRDRKQPLEAPEFLVPEAGARFLAKGEPFTLRARDVWDNEYRMELRAGTEPGSGSMVPIKAGSWLREDRIAGALVPAGVSGAGEPLPHLMGVHAYVTCFAEEQRLGLDLRVHNGLTAGSREPKPEESPGGIVYWKSLELVLPNGWHAKPFVADPFFGVEREEGDRVVVPIVRPNADGKLHMMGPQMQFHRRLVLYTNEALERPRGHPLLEGLAFPVPEQGAWSWVAPETPSFFPQHCVLPRWENFARSGHAGVAGLRAMLAEQFDAYAQLVQRGEANGDDVVATVMGWAHPWFYKYGGTTGGAAIQFFEGHGAAGVASASGYGSIALVHQMNASRQREAMWTLAGEPAGYEVWFDRDAGRVPIEFASHGGVVPREFRLPCEGGPAASAQVLEVVRRGLRPAYDQGNAHVPGGDYPSDTTNLIAWAPHDGQHMVRYTKDCKALVWLGNDALARDDLMLSAELFHLMFHESPGPEPGGVTLRAYEEHAALHPHQGAWLGREQAWGIDAMCAAYAIADEPWRAGHREWFARVAKMFEDVAMPSGILQRNSNPKVLGHPGYDATQTFETQFLLHAMRCMNETVFRGVDTASFDRLAALHRRTVEFLFFGPVWREDPGREAGAPSVGGPRTGFAVALSDGYVKPPFSDEKAWGKAYMPPDGIGSGPELFYGWQSLEYAARLSQESAGTGLENRYLQRALLYGSAKPDHALLLQGLFAGTIRRSSDTSSTWAGFAGYLQSLLP
jgi:hypothetical protein